MKTFLDNLSGRAEDVALDHALALLMRLRDRNVNSVNSAIIFILAARKPGMSPSKAVDVLGVGRFSIYKMVQDISDGRVDKENDKGLGLIDMDVRPDDRRQRQLWLTQSGKALVTDLVEDFKSGVERIDELRAASSRSRSQNPLM